MVLVEGSGLYRDHPHVDHRTDAWVVGTGHRQVEDDVPVGLSGLL